MRVKLTSVPDRVFVAICKRVYSYFKFQGRHSNFNCVSDDFLFLLHYEFEIAVCVTEYVTVYTGWPRNNGTVDTVDFQGFALINN